MRKARRKEYQECISLKKQQHSNDAKKIKKNGGSLTGLHNYEHYPPLCLFFFLLWSIFFYVHLMKRITVKSTLVHVYGCVCVIFVIICHQLVSTVSKLSSINERLSPWYWSMRLTWHYLLTWWWWLVNIFFLGGRERCFWATKLCRV